MSLAESMDARGFAYGGASSLDRVAGWAGLGALLALGGRVRRARRAGAGARARARCSSGSAALVAAVGPRRPPAHRTRYRPRRFTSADAAMAGARAARAARHRRLVGVGRRLAHRGPRARCAGPRSACSPWSRSRPCSRRCSRPAPEPVVRSIRRSRTLAPTGRRVDGAMTRSPYVVGVSFRYPGRGRPALARRRPRGRRRARSSSWRVRRRPGSRRCCAPRTGSCPHASGGRFAGDVVAFGRSTRTPPAPRPRRRRRLRPPGPRGPVRRRPRRARPRVRAREPRPPAPGDAAPRGGGARRPRASPTCANAPRARSRAVSANGARSRVRSPPRRRRSCSTSPPRSSTPRAPTTCSRAVGRLNADLGTTVLLAEHRLERAAPLADRAVIFDAGAIVEAPGDPRTGARRLRGGAAA